MLLDVSTFGFERVGEISISNGSECNESEKALRTQRGSTDAIED